MDWSDLKIISAIAKERSMRMAAAKVHLSQSAISKRVKKIEDKLEIPLFERTARGIKLTDRGKVLLPYINSALDILKEGLRHTQIKKEKKEIVKLGVSIPSIPLMHGLSGYFLNRNTKLEILTSDSPTIVSKLRESILDFGLFGYDEPPENLRSIALSRQNLYLIGPECFMEPFIRLKGKTIPYIRKQFINLLQDIPLILPKQANLRILIEELFAKELNNEPNVVAETDMRDMVKQLIDNQHGCALTIQTVSELKPQLTTTESSYTSLQIDQEKGSRTYRIPVNFLFSALFVYFAQATHVTVDTIGEVHDIYQNRQVKSPSWDWEKL